MPIPIILPKFGFTLETADIVQWLKNDGDTVRAGDPICEVTTDKVNMEVEAPESGTLFGLLFKPGDVVPVTEVIAYLLRPGETRPDTIPTSAPQAVVEAAAAIKPGNGIEQQPNVPGVSMSPLAQRVAAATNVDLNAVQGTGPKNRVMKRDVESAVAQPAGKVRATPAARHLAESSGVDLKLVSGSGPRGRIQSADVEAAISSVQPITVGVEATPVSSHQSQPEPTLSTNTPKVVKLEGMRRTIATRLQKSFQTAPHIFFDAQIDTTGIDSLRAKLKSREEKLSVTAMLVKACAVTLLRHPWLNATLENDEISLWPTANVGVAVALEAGLVVPVVHHAERLNLRDIQTSVDALVGKARSNSLRLNDMTDGTFTISNLGMYGVDRFTAIINPPQVAILAVGRTQRLFVPDANDQPVLRSFMQVTLSADHRVVDGAQAANFLQDLRVVLEEPALLAW